MPTWPSTHLRALSAEALDTHEVPLPLMGPGSSCTVRLRCLAGASGFQLVLATGDRVQLRAEISADPGEIVTVQVELDENGWPQVWSSGRDVLFLPVEDRYDPLPPITPRASDASLDLVLLIDGTTWHASPKEQEEHSGKLVTFAERLAEGRLDSRATVIAFGDQPPPNVLATDLIPKYHLFPGEEGRGFQSLELDRLRGSLLSVPPTPGGDFVDALADALDACARLRWRDNTRKLLVLSGDSPGCSVLYPLRRDANVCVRERDVDTQGLRLHRLGVETMTIYHDPPAERGLYDLEIQRDLLLGARSQYSRLASLPEYTFRASTFDPALAAAVFRDCGKTIGRGASLGEIVDVEAGQRTRTTSKKDAYSTPADEDLPPSPE